MIVSLVRLSEFLPIEQRCIVFPVRYELYLYVMEKKLDRLCGLVVRVPDYRTEMYCASCQVRNEFIYYREETRPPLWSSGQSCWLQNGDVLCLI
jgi:hypothetical protein